MRHVYVPAEESDQLSEENFRSSRLYHALRELHPDVLIIDLLWFTLAHFVDELKCRKIFICHQVIPEFFAINDGTVNMAFVPEKYDMLVGIEPFETAYDFTFIDPIILRNRNEILSREEALRRLSIDENGKLNALFAVNARPGDFERIKKTYSYLSDVGYNMVYSTNYAGGLFPIVDYFMAFDLVICLAGYNQFWECLYFEKEAVFETIPLYFSSMQKRIMDCGDYVFRSNGADQLVHMMLNG